jgi:hypothetical protein
MRFAQQRPAVPLVPGAAPQPAPAPSPLALDFTRLPARGPNPVSCLPACAPLDTIPLHRASLDAATAQWRDQTIACLESSGPASGATHHTEILANERAELAADTDELRARGARPREYRANLADICARKRREIELEYQYNVIFENTPLRRWLRTELDAADQSLAAIPPEMTWGNPVAMTFRRGTVHPTNPGVGGETNVRDIADTHAASIEIFDVAYDRGPYHWAAGLGPERRLHTFRHEVGHVVEEQIPQSALDELWNTLMEWTEFPWAWITAPRVPATPSTWTDARDRLMTMAGITADADLDAWLRSLVQRVVVDRNGRPWARQTHHNSPFLITWRDGAIPRGPEFEYARSGQGDYFAEVYTYATSRAEWLHDVLPADQIAWFKRNVFHVPATEDELVTQLARGPLPTHVLHRVSRLFTWQQIEAVLRTAEAGAA